MKEFLKDYNEMLVKPQFSFMKKHWKGYCLFTAACGVGSYLLGKHLGRLAGEHLAIMLASEEES